MDTSAITSISIYDFAFTLSNMMLYTTQGRVILGLLAGAVLSQWAMKR